MPRTNEPADNELLDEVIKLIRTVQERCMTPKARRDFWRAIHHGFCKRCGAKLDSDKPCEHCA